MNQGFEKQEQKSKDAHKRKVEGDKREEEKKKKGKHEVEINDQKKHFEK